MSTGADLAGILQLLEAPPLVLVLILVAVTFDFINGFHDAANAIATVVSTRVLTPRLAVYWAATFNFLACSTWWALRRAKMSPHLREVGKTVSCRLAMPTMVPPRYGAILPYGVVFPHEDRQGALALPWDTPEAADCLGEL
jgi:hypothetical protein